jgi:FlaA1/EpsC-like NDP-sugar epimerase
MNRFFMTIEEASQLVLQAAALGNGGEIFVLDMGAPVRIVDLARDLIRVSGLPVHAVDIVFSGVRPGEKLSEQLYFDDERHLATSHPKVMSTDHRPFVYEQARRMLRDLEAMVDGDEDLLLDKLKELVPEYAAQCKQSIAPRRSPRPVPTLTDGTLITTTPLGSPTA